MKTTLRTNDLHASAAAAYRRAANCRRHAKLSPHTADRELKSAAYWVSSARFWVDQARTVGMLPRFNEPSTWVATRLDNWDAELAALLTSPAAVAAEVE